MTKAKEKPKAEPKPKAIPKQDQKPEAQDASAATYESLLAEVRQLRKEKKTASQLAATNESLKNKVNTLTDEIRILKGERSEMSSTYNRMRNILMLGNSSTLELLIDEFVGFTTPQVRRIVLEAHLIEFDEEERRKLVEIIKYLNDSAIALQMMLESPSLSIDDSASKKQLKKLLGDMANSLKILSSKIDEYDQMQIKLLCSQFQEFQTFVNSFFQGGERQ